MPREPQAVGGIIWGTGQALEKSETGPVMGRLLNGNYSAYLVPTNVRIPEADVVFTGDFDHEASLPRQESARRADRRIGSARDIATAVHCATGVPVRTCP
jgi:CO/xanthine dehydrogenase Mo-binding subunit